MLRLYKRANNWIFILCLFVIMFVLQGILITMLEGFLHYSKGLKNPDQLFWYSTDYLERLYRTLGQSGTSFYRKMTYLDFVYAAFAGVAYSLLIFRLKRIKSLNFIVLSPLILSFFDWIENIGQLIIIRTGQINQGIGYLGSTASLLKMALGIVGLSSILYLTTRLLILKIKSTS